MARVLASVKVLSVLIAVLLAARVVYFAVSGMPDDALVTTPPMHPSATVGRIRDGAGAQDGVRGDGARAGASGDMRTAAGPPPPPAERDAPARDIEGSDGPRVGAGEGGARVADGDAHPATSSWHARRSWRRSEDKGDTGEADAARGDAVEEDPAGGDEGAEHGALAFGDVHLFYYMWYEAVDEGSSVAGHWNHNILPHWNENTKRKYKHDVTYEPWNDDIGSSFYPQRGLYTSADPALIDAHMAELSGFVIVVSWWGRPEFPNTVDGEGTHTPDLTVLMESAARHGVGVAFHLEPYEGRTAEMIHDDFCYLADTYGHHTSFYRDRARGNLPVYYAYDAYKVPAPEWARVLTRDGDLSVRGTPCDAIVISLLLSDKDYNFVRRGGFDGVYTYFAADGFTYGSTPSNWDALAKWAHAHGMLVSLSVGPGYDDERIRPWNRANTKSRDNGAYYTRHWARAAAVGADIVSVTSYNEWGEGTQIEPVVPKSIAHSILTDKPHKYRDYAPHEPEYYMEKTREYADQWKAGKRIH